MVNKSVCDFDIKEYSNKIGNYDEKQCLKCGVFFRKRIRESIEKWHTRKFCCVKCSNAYNGSAVKISIEKRFWKFVSKKKQGCWEWLGSTDRSGYGRISTKRGCSPIKAHRLSWEIHFGKIHKGLNVLHACDNPGCVNPYHLMLGTQVANTIDASRKKRLNEVSLLNLRPGSPGFIGAGLISTGEINDK